MKQILVAIFILLLSPPVNNAVQKSPIIVTQLLREESDRSPDSNEEFLAQTYINAISTINRDRPTSCQMLNSLKDDESFPLKDLALIKHLEYCANRPRDVLANYPEWMAKEYLNAALVYAFRIKDMELVARIYLEQSKLATIKTEKIELINKALALDISPESKQIAQERLYTVSPSKKEDIKRNIYRK